MYIWINHVYSSEFGLYHMHVFSKFCASTEALKTFCLSTHP